MKKTTIIILTISCLLTGFIGFKYANHAHQKELQAIERLYILTKENEIETAIKEKLTLLTYLREENPNNSIFLLESILDIELSNIGEYKFSENIKRNKEIQDLIRKVKSYREKYPFKNNNSEISNNVNRVLSSFK